MKILPINCFRFCPVSTVLLAILLFPVAAFSADFWSYEDYSRLFPGQQESTVQFSEQVRTATHTKDHPLDKAIQIAVVYPGLQASDYWSRSLSSFQARLDEHKISYRVHPFFSKPGIDLKLQAQQIRQALLLKPDYLIFTLDASKHQVLIERVLNQKKPAIILQNITTPYKKWGNQQPFMYVGFDHAEGTKILANAYLQRYKNKTARFAIIYGKRGYVSQMRGGTFKRLMAEQPNMQLVGEFYISPNRETARRSANRLLQNNPELDFIFSNTTDIALGVADAIQDNNRVGQVITNGWGGGQSELDAIADGRLALTVMRMNDDNGVAMADAIIRKIEGKTTPRIYSGDMLLIDQQTSVEQLQSYKETAFRYSSHFQSDIRQPSSHAVAR